MKLLALTCIVLALVSLGCNGLPAGSTSTTDDAKVTQVAEKATQIGNMIGGANGYGGTLMNGYMQHMSANMGFNSTGDLADPDGHMSVQLVNNSNQVCTFHLSYFDSNNDTSEQTQDVQVAANDQTTVQIPCSEIMGMGSLESPGGIACNLADGTPVSNMMAVPAFLGSDFTCGSMYQFMLQPDTNDLNGNGDTNELIVTSDSMLAHMGPNGSMGHMHDSGGMMGQQSGMMGQ